MDEWIYVENVKAEWYCRWLVRCKRWIDGSIERKTQIENVKMDEWLYFESLSCNQDLALTSHFRWMTPSLKHTSFQSSSSSAVCDCCFLSGVSSCRQASIVSLFWERCKEDNRAVRSTCSRAAYSEKVRELRACNLHVCVMALSASLSRSKPLIYPDQICTF